MPHDVAAQALAEGVLLANYDGASFKTADHDPLWLDDVEIAGLGGGAGVEAALARGTVLGEATNQARELSNEPGNRLTPRVFAERGAALAAAAGLGVEVLDETRIAELKMGLLLEHRAGQPGAAAIPGAAARTARGGVRRRHWA